MELDATKFKDGDRINHFLVNALRQLTAEERNILARNLLERSVAPPHEDKGAEEILRRVGSGVISKSVAIKAMQEYASNERNRAIGEVAEIAAKFFEGSHLKRINEELSKLKDLTIPTKK